MDYVKGNKYICCMGTTAQKKYFCGFSTLYYEVFIYDGNYFCDEYKAGYVQRKYEATDFESVLDYTEEKMNEVESENQNKSIESNWKQVPYYIPGRMNYD